jgi:energy-coupling factor transporter ATP-binding protein EcfA2
MILSRHDGANYHDPHSTIYSELEAEIPTVSWTSTDATSPGGIRPFFRDAREPWSSTGVVRFDDSLKSLTITSLGKQLADGAVSAPEVFMRAMETHTQGAESPFRILAAAFLDPAASRGLTLDQLMGGVMQNYRPGVDELATVLTEFKAASFLPTPTRRFKQMLKMLETVGAISNKDAVYIGWSPALLQRLARTEFKSNSGFHGFADQFARDCTDSGLVVSAQATLRLAASCGSKRFLILTGLSGSGKTKLAQAFARWITPADLAVDIFTPGAAFPSSIATYYVSKSDDVAVEFWNSLDEAAAVKVVLPRELISEWASYIKSNALPPSTPAREIREAVKVTSKFSDQLQSFETHLKTAAFAVVNNGSQESHSSCYAFVPVGADWTSNENVLGYPDGLQANIYVAKPALDLILHAERHGDVPHFLILDEMNLSHVERYFADILSLIESNEYLDLYPGDLDNPQSWRTSCEGKVVPPRLKQLPENVFIIGTVNVDETTYMFSPKVLDRANVIEFRMSALELEGFLDNLFKPDLLALGGKGALFGSAFVDACKNPADIPVEVKWAFDTEMLLLFKLLQPHGMEFGYRSAYEAARFVHFYKLLGNHQDGDRNWISGAVDCVILQKILPKLHGSRVKLGPVLKKLWFICVNDLHGRGPDAIQGAEIAVRSTDKKYEPSADNLDGALYPLSAEKILRMWRLMIENGFASFNEA